MELRLSREELELEAIEKMGHSAKMLLCARKNDMILVTSLARKCLV